MILVTGATGYTGRFLVRRLVEQGAELRCLVRPASQRAELERLGVEVRVGDLDQPDTLRGILSGVCQVLHLAHIRRAPALLGQAGTQVEQFVLVSSLRRFSRVPSASVDEVIRGEEAALQSGRPCTLLRPSMIYGPGDDRNISRLAAHLRQRRWIPVVGRGQGLQQPVYVEDVVAGIMEAARRPQAVGRSYALAGPVPLTYDQLIDLVGAAVGVAPLKIHLPVGVALAGLRVARRLGLRPGVEEEQILRLQEDKSCTIEAARLELGYAPLGFEEGLARIFGTGGSA